MYNWTYVSPLSEFSLDKNGKLTDKEYNYSTNLFWRVKKVGESGKTRRTKVADADLPNSDRAHTPHERLVEIQAELDTQKLVLEFNGKRSEKTKR
jgi:hypothetical protein